MELPIIFKTLGDSTRLRMLGLLLERELCVCDIESVLEISQVNASRHLLKMKSAGILTSRKTAQWVYYKINSEFLRIYPELIDYFRIELRGSSVYKRDIKTMTVLKKKNTDIKC